ncbi:glycosyltransferase [bacterium]|nr:glycosyltransferase [bacterium]
MNKLEKITILMAAYNAERTIRSAIESVSAQTCADWELIVVNDCSKDGTQAIVSEFAAKDLRIKLINNETNLGVSLTRKKALDTATGAWIAVLDSDDMWAPNKLEKQLAFAKKTGADLVFTASAFMDNDGNPIDWVQHAPETVSYCELLKQNIISNSSALVKRDLYEKFYAIGDKMHEDFAMWLNIIKAGYKACGLDEPLLIYRLAKSSKSSNKLKAAKMTWNAYRYIGLNPLTASYYMCWYTIKSLLKYRNLK